MHAAGEQCLDMISLTCLILSLHHAETGTTLDTHITRLIDLNSAGHITFCIQELDIQSTVIVLRSTEIHLHLQLLTGGYHPLHFGIVVGIRITEQQTAIL